MHGSKGGRPIVHGNNSKRLEKVKDEIRDKIELHLQHPDPEDTREEMAVLRAFLDMAIEKHGDMRIVGVDADGNAIEATIDSTGHVTMLVDTIRKTAHSRSQMRNQTAYTQAHVALILANVANIVRKHVPEGERAAVAREIQSGGGLLPEPGEAHSAG